MTFTNQFRTDGWVKSVQGYATPGAQIFVCQQPANTTSLPPSPLANIFSDVNGLVPITQPILTDGFGHYDFYASAGVYTIVVALNGVISQVYPDQSVGGASGTSGAGGGTALNLQVNGTSNVNQLLLNLVGQNSVSVSDAGNGTVNIIGSVFQTNGTNNATQNKVNLISGTGINVVSDLLGNVTIGVTGTALGLNIIQRPTWGGSTVFPENGTYAGTLNPGSNTTFEAISSALIINAATKFKLTIYTVSASTTVTCVMIQCTRGTGNVIASAPVTFGGAASPTFVSTGLQQSDAISFSITPGFDYYFALNTSHFIGVVAPGTGLAGAAGGVVVANSNALPIGTTLPSWSGSTSESSNCIIFDLVTA